MKPHFNCPGAVPQPRSRRDFLQAASNGFGLLALASLMAEQSDANQPSLSRKPHFPARAKHVIFCFMDGGPSHVDTFDYKPQLAKLQGQAIGDNAVSKLSQSSANRVWLGSPWRFRQRGLSGLSVSDLLPEASGSRSRRAAGTPCRPAGG